MRTSSSALGSSKLFLVLGICSLFAANVNGENWWQSMSLYQIYPRSFQDSDGDGVGDLKGIQSRLSHLQNLNVNAIWLSPIYKSPMVDFGYDISDFRAIDPIFGTMEDFEQLVEAAHKLSIKIIMDFVPNHSSDKHEWFEKSVKSQDPYKDYFVWHKGNTTKDGKKHPPNNWVSVFGGKAWTYHEERKEWYLHQFAKEQPDLNFFNPKVVQEMKDVLKFWLDKGVDGFRIDAIPHLFEDKEFKDEPLTGSDDPNSYGYTDHIYTKDLQETYDMVKEWRKLIDEYSKKDNVPRIIMTEAYTSVNLTMKYYDYGSHFPFNFWLINEIVNTSKAANLKEVVDRWMKEMPENAVANWVTGNHDKSRLATRFGEDKARAITVLSLLLPGVCVTYNGEEIGMQDTWISWEDTKDPQGINAGKENYLQSSRDPQRTPFQWNSSTSAGFSTNNVTWLPVNENYVTLNLAAQIDKEDSYYEHYRKARQLRDLKAVREGSLITKSFSDNVFGFVRETDDEDEEIRKVYVIINFSDKSEQVNLNEFDDVPSSLKVYQSTSREEAPLVDYEKVDVPAFSAVVYVGSSMAVSPKLFIILIAGFFGVFLH